MKAKHMNETATETLTPGQKAAATRRARAAQAAPVLNGKETPSQYAAKQFKIVALRETPISETLKTCDNPETVSAYWDEAICTDPAFNSDVENFVVLFLNTRRKTFGHQVISQGTLDTLLVHPREVFRAACIMGAAAIVIMHNHPSGDPTPSEADIKVTRDLVRAGQLMKIDVLDHVVKGDKRNTQTKPYCSLRELGYFYA